ncbi:MAG: CHY zinc finger protein [Pyrinomonadaceae bacterium]
MKKNAMRQIFGEMIYGGVIDDETRCIHWNSPLDIIAIKFSCCGQWYPCYDCHREAADHEAAPWPQTERHVRAVLCGGCGHKLSIDEYLDCGSICPACGRRFNPGCARHYHLYFE